MKLKLLFTIWALPFFSFAQQDPAVIYKNRAGENTTKDSAYSYQEITKNGSVWHAKEYYTTNNILKSEGDYTDKNITMPTGRVDNYLQDGTLATTYNYINGKLADKTYYYKSGIKKAYISYNNGETNQQKGWDENGSEIPGYIVEQQARFYSRWNEYLERHLKGNVAEKAGMASGEYKVVVSFTVDKDGTVINVKADSFTGNCEACAKEAIRVISNSPAWQPAIQYNRQVLYRQRQRIVFQVAPTKRSRD